MWMFNSQHMQNFRVKVGDKLPVTAMPKLGKGASGKTATDTEKLLCGED